MSIKKSITKLATKIANRVSQNSNVAKESRISSPEMIKLCRKAGSEGIVMLKNKGNALPIKKGSTISVFGRTQINWFYVGYGSGGDVAAPYKISLIDALKARVDVKLFEPLLKKYENWCFDNPPDDGIWGHWPMCYEEMLISESDVINASKNSTTAVVVIGRSAGEDRESTLSKGSFYLTDDEHEMLRLVTKHFLRVVVLLDCGSIMDLGFLDEFGDKISSVLFVWQGGMESGNAICDVLLGDTSPCGRLPDTIAKSYEDYPSSDCFGKWKENVYKEDIFVGYRYFSTFAPDKVLYPFGFGLSYTTFDTVIKSVKQNGFEFSVLCDVKNTGENFSSKEVVELFLSAPTNRLSKPKRVLVDFKKTDLIAPQRSELLRLDFDLRDFASYDESGKTGSQNTSCYVLEKGEYELFLGKNVRDCESIYSFKLDETVVTKRLRQVLAPSEKFGRLTIAKDKSGNITKSYKPVRVKDYDLSVRIKERLKKEIEITGDKGLLLSDVKENKCTLDEFVAQLSIDELEAISRGDYTMNSPLGASGNAGAIGGVLPSLRKKGIPPCITTDGPSGIRLNVTCSLLPNGVCLASTFNTVLIKALYVEMGKEMKKRGSNILLAPGMNIHRNPLCGRNFEYFSEDPFLTGKMAASVVNGIQQTGVSACPKHFACNNQETNRTKNNSIVSERALREIYLKGFEIMVKESHPKNIMTSYNKINSVWSHYNFELCQMILREEWGFEGNIMTDWWMQSSKSPEFKGVKDQAYRIRSGVNVLMPGGKRAGRRVPDGSVKSSLKAKDGLTIGELQQNAKWILKMAMEFIT